MFYDKEISILSDTGFLDENGLWVKGVNETVKTIECDVQPYSRELAYRDYSFEEDVKYRVFVEPDETIKLGAKVEYKDTIYNIVKIIDWDDYFILLLDN